LLHSRRMSLNSDNILPNSNFQFYIFEFSKNNFIFISVSSLNIFKFSIIKEGDIQPNILDMETCPND